MKKQKILFIDRSTGLQTVDDLQTKPRGGMVGSLFKISDYLSSVGHDVDILSDIVEPGTTIKGAHWINAVYRDVYDTVVCNRGIGDGYPWINAKKRILWTHDLPHNGFAENPKMLSVFITVFMSNFAERIWRTFYKDIGQSVLIPNGVDKKLFYPRKKDHDYLIYFSHPNRGLNKLPLICDAISTRLGRPIKFHAYSSVKMYPNDQDIRDHATESTLDYAGSERLKVLSPIPQHRLAEEVGKAGLMIMPSGYPEICSNNVLQALASGTPIITTGNLGATQEWVKNGKNGALTTFLPNDYMVHSVEIVRASVVILSDRYLHNKLINGAKKTPVYTWDQIGEKWNRLILS